MEKIYNVKNATVGLPVGWAGKNPSDRKIVEKAAEFAGRTGHTAISFDTELDACVELTCHHNEIYWTEETVYCDIWYAELAIVEDGKEIAWSVIKTAGSTNNHKEEVA